MPLTQFVLFTFVAVIAGVTAAVLPARRASRLNVLEALQYEQLTQAADSSREAKEPAAVPTDGHCVRRRAARPVLG